MPSPGRRRTLGGGPQPQERLPPVGAAIAAERNRDEQEEVP